MGSLILPEDSTVEFPYEICPSSICRHLSISGACCHSSLEQAVFYSLRDTEQFNSGLSGMSLPDPDSVTPLKAHDISPFLSYMIQSSSLMDSSFDDNTVHFWVTQQATSNGERLVCEIRSI